MRGSRRLLVLAVVALAAGLTVGTGGFTTATADRGVTVSVAEDGNAFLGVTVEDPELDNGNHREVELVSFENQFPGDVTLQEVRVTRWHVVAEQTPGNSTNNGGSGPVPNVRNVSGTVGDPGVVAEVACGNGGTDDAWKELAVDVRVEASGVAVELTRDVTVTCTGDPPGDNQNGNSQSSSSGSESASPASSSSSS